MRKHSNSHFSLGHGQDTISEREKEPGSLVVSRPRSIDCFHTENCWRKQGRVALFNPTSMSSSAFTLISKKIIGEPSAFANGRRVNLLLLCLEVRKFRHKSINPQCKLKVACAIRGTQKIAHNRTNAPLRLCKGRQPHPHVRTLATTQGQATAQPLS